MIPKYEMQDMSVSSFPASQSPFPHAQYVPDSKPAACNCKRLSSPALEQYLHLRQVYDSFVPPEHGRKSVQALDLPRQHACDWRLQQLPRSSAHRESVGYPCPRRIQRHQSEPPPLFRRRLELHQRRRQRRSRRQFLGWRRCQTCHGQQAGQQRRLSPVVSKTSDVPIEKSGNLLTKSDSKLLTHLYSYFGILLGCSQSGKDGLPAYDGEKSQYDVHK